MFELFFFLVTLRELPLFPPSMLCFLVYERHPLHTRDRAEGSCMCWIANRNCEARLVTPLFASVSAGDNEMKPFQCASSGREAFLRGYFENSTSAILVR